MSLWKGKAYKSLCMNCLTSVAFPVLNILKVDVNPPHMNINCCQDNKVCICIWLLIMILPCTTHPLSYTEPCKTPESMGGSMLRRSVGGAMRSLGSWPTSTLPLCWQRRKCEPRACYTRSARTGDTERVLHRIRACSRPKEVLKEGRGEVCMDVHEIRK